MSVTYQWQYLHAKRQDKGYDPLCDGNATMKYWNNHV